MEGNADGLPVIAVTAAVGAVVLLIGLLMGLGKKSSNTDATEDDPKSTTANGSQSLNRKHKQKTNLRVTKKEGKLAFTHPWLASSLRGHSTSVLDFDFSPNGKYLISCSEDRALFIWSVKEFNQKEHKFMRSNVELDNATKIKFSPDSRAFIVSLNNGNKIRVFKIGKKADGSVGNVQAAPDDFPQVHCADIINIGIASTGRFIMTCFNDTTIRLYDLKGDVLATIDTLQVNNTFGAVSPCGRFVASSGFTPDVKVWEVVFDKSGGYKVVIRAFELKGHSAGVYSFDFNNDSTRMVSVSKDSTWKLWDTDIQYQKGQEPYLLNTGDYKQSGFARIVLSPDARTAAISTERTISVYSSLTMSEEQSIHNPHNESIKCLSFDNSSRYLLSGGDKQIHIFHNVVGYRATIVDAEEKKKKATNAPQKARLRQQIDEAREALREILGEEQR